MVGYDTRVHGVLFVGVVVLIVVAYLAMAMFAPMAYIWATYEDLYGEWTQTFLFAAGALISAWVARRPGPYRLWFGFLALACLYTFLEEISWGQRVFGFASPDYFRARNLQGETNIHNFFVGPYGTTLKATIEYLLAAALFGYGVLYRLLFSIGVPLARWVDRLGVAPPPGYVAPAFLVAAVLELQPFSFNEAEVAEVLVGLGIVGIALHYAVAQAPQTNPHDAGQWPGSRVRVLVTAMTVTFVLVGAAAWATTQAVYADPQWRERVDRRISNGVKKFAGRYERYENWAMATRLYERSLAERPASASRMRRLARVHLAAGRRDAHDALLAQAVDSDLERLRANNASTSARRSLARSYRMLGDHARADAYLQEALKIGIARVAHNPQSHNAAYSLARTYELQGRFAEALREYERAYRLAPTVSRNRKAYTRAKLRFGG